MMYGCQLFLLIIWHFQNYLNYKYTYIPRTSRHLFFYEVFLAILDGLKNVWITIICRKKKNYTSPCNILSGEWFSGYNNNNSYRLCVLCTKLLMDEKVFEISFNFNHLLCEAYTTAQLAEFASDNKKLLQLLSQLVINLLFASFTENLIANIFFFRTDFLY